jgi:outer membrane receptor protein involved in Fe transport
MRRFGLFAAVSAVALSAPAAAQDAAPTPGEGEIIVTATKRAQSILDVPFSVNAQTAEDIARTGATNIEDIARNVAGLAVQNLGPGQSQVVVRGVSAGQVVRDQPGVKEQVGFYLDESVVSLSLFTPDLDLFDLNRVETLRGPQGTLFGSGSVGGTIRYITNQPTTERVEGAVEGNVNLVQEESFGGHLKGAVNVPLGERVAVRAVGYYTRYGGFIDALREGGGRDRNVNSGERYGGRLSALFQLGETVTLTPRIVYQKVDVDGFNRQEEFNLYANPFTTMRPRVRFREREQYLLLRERFRDEFLLADLTAEWEAGPVTVTSVTSYVDRDILVSRDASALTGSVSVDLGFSTAAVLLPSNLRDTTKLEQFTQEARLASNYESPVQWVLGVYYARSDRTYAQRLPTPGYDAATDAVFGPGTSASTYRSGLYGPDSPYNSDLPYELRQWAIFGEATWAVTGRLNLTAGARYYNFDEERRFLSGGLFSNLDDRTDTTSSDGVNPRFIASYELSDTVTVNAQAAKGFRLGGVNDPLNVPLCTPEDRAIFGGFQDYGDETLWNYEGGVKAQKRGFRLGAAVFYNQIKDLQVTLDAGSCSSRIVFNVDKAHAAGGEVELGFTPIDGLDLSVAANFVEAEFDSTVTTGAGVVVGGIRKGNRLPSVPEFTLAATGTYSFALSDATEAFVSATFQHIGSRFTQPSDQEDNPRRFVSNLPFGGASGADATVLDLELPAYQLLNLSAGLRFANGFDLTAYITNVTNENAKLAFDRERGGRARLGFHVSNPRVIGLTARKSF